MKLPQVDVLIASGRSEETPTVLQSAVQNASFPKRCAAIQSALDSRRRLMITVIDGAATG